MKQLKFMYAAENKTALWNNCGKKCILASGCSEPSSELLLGCIHKAAEAPLKAKLGMASRNLNKNRDLQLFHGQDQVKFTPTYPEGYSPSFF